MSKQLFLNVNDYLVQSVMKKMSWITEQLNTPVKMLGNSRPSSSACCLWAILWCLG